MWYYFYSILFYWELGKTQLWSFTKWWSFYYHYIGVNEDILSLHIFNWVDKIQKHREKYYGILKDTWRQFSTSTLGIQTVGRISEYLGRKCPSDGKVNFNDYIGSELEYRNLSTFSWRITKYLNSFSCIEYSCTLFWRVCSHLWLLK